MISEEIQKNFNDKNLSLIRKYIFEILVILLMFLSGFQWINQKKADDRFIKYLEIDKSVLIKTIENNTQAIHQNNLILNSK